MRTGAAQVVGVLTWGEEPIGAANADALDVIAGAQLSGVDVLAAFGERGSPEETDFSILADPQAFNGHAGAQALSTYAPPHGRPVLYPEEARLTLLENEAASNLPTYPNSYGI